MLNGDNFSDWKDQVLLTLGLWILIWRSVWMNHQFLRTQVRLLRKASYEQWERSNRLSLMLIKKYISKGIRGSIPECTKVKDFLKAIEDQYMRDIAAQLKPLEVDISEPFLVHLILNSLPKEKTGDKKKDCPKYKKWLEKKGISQPKKTNGKWTKHLFRQPDAFPSGGYWNF
ncbi:UNVERIFIED_CONTAM: hypothetical protein Slati_1111200 [Sesamum latifolium]|uniref:Uncharacterized protein n=1 Tax=Sesamum latifolium TaxID=2727402 RepID=A0AAW2XGL1_9LAMI